VFEQTNEPGKHKKPVVAAVQERLSA